MTKYASWPTVDSGNVVGARLANEIYIRFGDVMANLSFDDQKDASLAELLADLGGAVDIDSGTIDGATIGGTTPAEGTFSALTVNQGAEDGNAIDLKSSDVDHSYTNGQETDSFFTVRKSAASLGGASLTAVAEDSAALGRVFQVILRGGTGDTTHTASGEGLFHISAAEHDGAGTLADVTATGNVFAVAARVSGADRTVFIIDEDGNYWFDGAAQTAFDAYDDVELVRAFALATSDDVIRTDFDDFVRYNEDDLVGLGILGDRVEDGGLVNGAQLQRLLVGAVWQQAQAIEAMRTEIKALTP